MGQAWSTSTMMERPAPHEEWKENLLTRFKEWRTGVRDLPRMAMDIQCCSDVHACQDDIIRSLLQGEPDRIPDSNEVKQQLRRVLQHICSVAGNSEGLEGVNAWLQDEPTSEGTMDLAPALKTLVEDHLQDPHTRNIMKSLGQGVVLQPALRLKHLLWFSGMEREYADGAWKIALGKDGDRAVVKHYCNHSLE
eukprot:NODE_9290_length_651_cov_74.551136_g9024_i0.p1 GENE.NODE_9290_length_651_cov_74.551136_g9024_i0~~NODE_9290_length_651_cov_74.551136_g9024_i0.p1  ORF type:complete len:193 (+),score=21.29 NODE_9290_length_651_cov_74.551136_g9024_i0:65-643(+)